MRIIYIDIDSTRPDHFGCYGYHRNTTPNIDEIARKGVKFDHAYCNSSPCVPSRAGLITSRFGIHNGVVTNHGVGCDLRFPGEGHHYDKNMPIFTRHLRQNGYRTISFSSFPDRHQAFWFTAGWEEMHSFTLKGGEEDADEVNEAVLPWIEEHGQEEDYFLHVNYWDPHRLYTVPEEWPRKFKDVPPPAWPDEEAIIRHQENYGVFSASELFPRSNKSPINTMPDSISNVEDFKKMVDGYDGALRYADHHIGQIFETLDRLDVLDDTAIIISADHGEAMGEQGIYGDHVCASEAIHNIPLIINWPGVTESEITQTGFLYNVDLAPTICELLDIDIPPGWDGESFAPALRGEKWSGRPYLVWDHGSYTCQRVVRTDKWLYTQTYHPGIFPFADNILYNMEDDPHQTKNIYEDHPDIVSHLDHLLSKWLQENIGIPGACTDPLQEVIEKGPWAYVDLDYWLNRLRDRGRHRAVEEITERLNL